MSQELKNNKNIELWKVDVDGKHNIAKSQRISAMPTFKMYVDGGVHASDGGRCHPSFRGDIYY